jgi:predicted secreted protein
MENKQTAVEWLFEERLGLTLQLENRKISHKYWELQMVKLYEQAKEMEKQQIIDAHNQGYADGYRDNGNSPIEYYEQTYRGKDGE